MPCEHCGNRLPVNARFCPTCGALAPALPAMAPALAASPVNGAAPALPRDDLRAALGARQELGAAAEQEVIDSFLARVERSLDAHIDARVDARLGGRLPARRKGNGDGEALALAIVSLGTAIPITGIAASTSGVAGVIFAWAGIAAVNVAYALRGRRG